MSTRLLKPGRSIQTSFGHEDVGPPDELLGFDHVEARGLGEDQSSTLIGGAVDALIHALTKGRLPWDPSNKPSVRGSSSQRRYTFRRRKQFVLSPIDGNGIVLLLETARGARD